MTYRAVLVAYFKSRGVHNSGRNCDKGREPNCLSNQR